MNDIELDKQLLLLQEQNELLQRDMYTLMHATNTARESCEAIVALVVQLYKLVKDTHPTYNFGLGGKIGPDIM